MLVITINVRFSVLIKPTNVDTNGEGLCHLAQGNPGLAIWCKKIL